MAKRYARIETIVPWDLAHDVWMIVEGKQLEWNMVPVRHGGESENGLQALPPVKDIILAFASSQDTFKPRELKEALTERGRSIANIYGQIGNLVRDGLLKRVEEGIYALATHKKPAKQSKRGRYAKTREAAKKPHGGVRAAALEIIRAAQNGNGEGVPSDLITEKMVAQGFGHSSISTTLSQLTAAKKLKRVSPGRYRAMEA